jgi:RNA polymerase sigma-70 factor (ECF subfamily)
VYEHGESLSAEAVASMQRDLVEQARDGDVDAFTQLVKVSAPRLHGVANLILRDPDRAKDAVQDALMSAWRDLGALRDADAWDAWLRRLTVRSCYRLANKDRRRTLIEQEIAPVEPYTRLPDASADIADRLWVEDAIRRLDMDQRVVVVLHYYLDLPLRQVAEIIDIPFGTAASRLHRGLESLRASLRAEPGAAHALVTHRPT